MISKGKVIVNHARGTYIYALDGAEVSFATSVRSINTNERKVSWGNINNRHVEPLFESEPGNL